MWAKNKRVWRVGEGEEEMEVKICFGREVWVIQPRSRGEATPFSKLIQSLLVDHAIRIE